MQPAHVLRSGNCRLRFNLFCPFIPHDSHFYISVILLFLHFMFNFLRIPLFVFPAVNPVL